MAPRALAASPLAAIALLFALASCTSDPASCPSSGACPDSCTAITMRLVDVTGMCQRPAADPGCTPSHAALPAITACCADPAGDVFMVNGFPGCDLRDLRPCTAAQVDLAQATSNACR